MASSFRERLCTIPRANRELISREKRGRLGMLFFTQAFVTPLVLRVISCDCVSLHPGLGIIGGVECLLEAAFNIYLFDFLCIVHHLHQVVVGFP